MVCLPRQQERTREAENPGHDLQTLTHTTRSSREGERKAEEKASRMFRRNFVEIFPSTLMRRGKPTKTRLNVNRSGIGNSGVVNVPIDTCHPGNAKLREKSTRQRGSVYSLSLRNWILECCAVAKLSRTVDTHFHAFHV